MSYALSMHVVQPTKNFPSDSTNFLLRQFSFTTEVLKKSLFPIFQHQVQPRDVSEYMIQLYDVLVVETAKYFDLLLKEMLVLLNHFLRNHFESVDGARYCLHIQIHLGVYSRP